MSALNLTPMSPALASVSFVVPAPAPAAERTPAGACRQSFLGRFLVALMHALAVPQG